MQILLFCTERVELYIIDNILSILKSKSLKQVDMCEYIGINTSTMTTWKNRKTDPPAKYIIRICEFLGVSPYVLLTGKEKNSPAEELTADEQELLTMYKNMTDINKARLLERGQALIEQQPQIKTAYVAARSFDNEPPSVVTGDFSDILNALDATDEY